MWNEVGANFYIFPHKDFLNQEFWEVLVRWFISDFYYQRGHLELKDLLPKWLLCSNVWWSGSLTILSRSLSHMVAHPQLGLLHAPWDSHWWPQSCWTSYLAAHDIKRTRWKLLAHLWSKISIVSILSYSFGERSHRKLNSKEAQGKRDWLCLSGRDIYRFVAILTPPRHHTDKIILFPIELH